MLPRSIKLAGRASPRRKQPFVRNAGLLVLALATTTACSYKHAGKAVVGGLALSAGGFFVLSKTAEAEGDTRAPMVGLGIGVFGALVALAGIVAVLDGPPPRHPLEPPEPPQPPEKPEPIVIGAEALRSQKRVARFMAERGKCDQVLQISMRVERADPRFHAASFATDETIARCLHPTRE
jgi:hypothetical protein